MIAWFDGITKCLNPRWAHQGLGHDFQENENAATEDGASR
jgi:hypothetical protein